MGRQKYYEGATINGVILLRKDLERSNSKNSWWYYQCPRCGIERSARNNRVGALCPKCHGQVGRAAVTTPFVTDDLTGREFGNWIVLGKAPKNNFWHCKCQRCGTERDVFRGSLTTGDSKGCGCIKSWGETQITYLLNEAGANYKREVTFKDLHGLKGGSLRFDFGIYDKEDKLIALIEYNGRQHYTFNSNWNQSEEEFKLLQAHDDIKRRYCKEHDIKLYELNSQDNLPDMISNILLNTKGGA